MHWRRVFTEVKADSRWCDCYLLRPHCGDPADRQRQKNSTNPEVKPRRGRRGDESEES